MTPEALVRFFRTLLMGTAGALCLGTVVELILVGHTEDLWQWVPFGLCGLGAIALFVAHRWPGRTSLRMLRGVMALLALGGLLGVYQHVSHNWAFALEIRPNTPWQAVFWEALGGASPLMAPGILLLIALLAVAATWHHPLLDASPTPAA